MLRHRFSIIGMAAVAVVALLLMTQDNFAQPPRVGYYNYGGNRTYYLGYTPYYYRVYGYYDYPRQYYSDFAPNYGAYYDPTMLASVAPEVTTSAVITVNLPAEAESWVQDVKMSNTG